MKCSNTFTVARECSQASAALSPSWRLLTIALTHMWTCILTQVEDAACMLEHTNTEINRYALTSCQERRSTHNGHTHTQHSRTPPTPHTSQHTHRHTNTCRTLKTQTQTHTHNSNRQGIHAGSLSSFISIVYCSD